MIPHRQTRAMQHRPNITALLRTQKLQQICASSVSLRLAREPRPTLCTALASRTTASFFVDFLRSLRSSSAFIRIISGMAWNHRRSISVKHARTWVFLRKPASLMAVQLQSKLKRLCD